MAIVTFIDATIEITILEKIACSVYMQCAVNSMVVFHSKLAMI